jgi:phosphocarrier protein
MEKSTGESADASQSRELTVRNKMGIHARPAAMIVRIANRYDVEVTVEKDDEDVNGKSIMGLMMLAAGQGSKLRFKVEGDAGNASQLLDELEGLFERKFEEA